MNSHTKYHEGGHELAILSTFSENGPRKITLNFGDVSDSGGILTFDLQKLKGDNQRPRVFDHKATNCFT